MRAWPARFQGVRPIFGDKMCSRKETLSPPKIASDPSGVDGYVKIRAGESMVVAFTGGRSCGDPPLAARLIHPWDEPMGVCTRKRVTP